MDDERGTGALPSLETMRDVMVQVGRDEAGKLFQMGATKEQLEIPEIKQAFRRRVFDTSFAALRDSFGYDEAVINEGLKRLGFDDFIGAEKSRERSMAEAAEMVADAKAAQIEKDQQLGAQVERSMQKPKSLREFFGMVAAGEASTAMARALTPEQQREIPSRVGAAIAALENVPLVGLPNPAFDPRAQEDRKLYQEAVQYRVPGFELPGVDTLTEKAHVPHWLADLVVEDTLDPASWLQGGPMLLAGAAGAVGGSTLLYKAMRSAVRTGSRVGFDELINVTAKAAGRVTDELATELYDAVFSPADIRAMATSAKGGGEVREKAFGRMAKLFSTNRGGLVAGRESVDGRFFADLKRLAAKGEVDLTHELLDARIMMTQSSDELARLQARATKALGDDLNIEVVRRADLKERFFNREFGRFEEIDAGLVARFVRNPEDFTTATGKFAKTPEAQALRRLLGAPDDMDAREAFRWFSNLEYVGGGRHMSQTMAGLSWLKRTAPGAIREMDFPWRRGFERWLGSTSQRLAQTPVFKPIIFATTGRTTEMGYWAAKWHAATGGKVFEAADSLTDLMVTGGTGYKLRGRSVLAPRNRSIGGRVVERIFDPGRSARARQLNDELVWLLGDTTHREALANARTRDGLGKLVISDEARIYAGNIRRLFDELGREAIRLGFVDPDTWVNNYLPRIYRDTKRGGMTVDGVIRRIRKGDPAKGFQAEPGFAFARTNQDPADLVTDIRQMYNSYVSMFTKHKYLKPVADDVIKVISSSTSSLTGLERARAFEALDLLHHSLGGTTSLEARFLESAQDLAENVKHMRERGISLGERMDDLFTSGNAQEKNRRLRWGFRQLTDMWYTNYIGAKIGLATRNLTQQALGVPQMGGGVRGWEHLVRGAQRIRKDTALFETYVERANLWNWHNEYYDVASEAFDNVAREIPDLLPVRYKQALMGFYQLSDMQNRANVWAGGYDFAESVVEKLGRGKRVNWKNSARIFTADERASLERLLQAGEHGEFKKQYADAVVNNSQWLYNRRNRPKWLQDHPIAGSFMVFLTWPMNYAGAVARAGYGAVNPASRGAVKAAQYMRGVGDFLLPSIMMGAALEGGSRALGFGSMGSWLFPELEELPQGKKIKGELGYDSETKIRLPIPIKPLLLPWRMATGDEPLGGSLPVLRAWFKGAAAASEVGLGAIFEDREEQRARAIDQFAKAVPLLPQGLQPITSAIGRDLGIEEDAAWREGIMEQVLGAIMGVSESDGMVEDFIRSSGFGRPGEEEILYPIEKTQ